MLAITVTALLVVAAFGLGWVLGRAGIGPVGESVPLTEAERRFIERMRDVVLVGSFTEDGDTATRPEPERYEIRRVEKVGEDRWRFHAVLDCCGVQGSLPVTLPMRWLGDTPILEMTDTRIPGVGTFTVRLLFRDDRYAGTWSRGERGGAMSGRIERRTEAAATGETTACGLVGPAGSA